MTALYDGFVTINEQVFYTFSKVNSHFIHTIAQSNSKKRIDFQDFLIDERIRESEFVKKQMLASFQDKPSIQKNEIGVPYLHQNEKKPIPVSISHHGSYGAFAYQKS
jgi:phosphopantetheinyl transferase